MIVEIKLKPEGKEKTKAKYKVRMGESLACRMIGVALGYIGAYKKQVTMPVRK